MKANLRALYFPVQPTVKQSAEGITYSEYLPEENLLHAIYCYWELKSLKALEQDFHYRVVTDGCIDIFFEINNPKENFVMGFCRKYTEFSLGKSFHYVGIRFLPGIFPYIFNADAALLSNRVGDLKEIAPATATFIAEYFNKAQNIVQIKELLNRHFTDLLSNTTFEADRRFEAAVEIILKQSGLLNVETDLDTGISPRQLRRLFNYYIGDTAKNFSKVIRFQSVLKAGSSFPPVESKLFLDAGYYDQSHFIKEFKNFYGVTPSKALGK